MSFDPLPGVRYGLKYHEYLADVKAGKYTEREAWRSILMDDTWAVVFFALQMPNANHPFVINACREVDKGPQTRTLDIWAREHFKSTIFTKARTIQRLLNDPQERICIFSYSRALALMFLRSVKFTLESSEWLQWLFPDILWANPEKEAPTWGEETGIVVKRRGAPNEASVEAWGLIEGMPTGRHFTGRIYDDIETPDLVTTPDMVQKVKDQFDMSENTGAEGGWECVVGTYYSHTGPLMYIRDKKDEQGRPIYTTRLKPATESGLANGRPVFLSEDRLRKLRTNLKAFYSQQLCDPTPRGEEKLKWEFVKIVKLSELPERLHKLVIVDPAGERKDGKGDAWSILVFGVEPLHDMETGITNVYLMDGIIAEMSETDAFRQVVTIYCRSGRVLKLCVEKVAQSSAEKHIQNALRAKGRFVSEEAETLHILRPGKRNKQQRILHNLRWPLENSKFHILETVPAGVRDRLKTEMEKFPAWHDDGLDTCAYVYDVIADCRFALQAMPEPVVSKPRDAWDEAFDEEDGSDIRGFLVA